MRRVLWVVAIVGLTGCMSTRYSGDAADFDRDAERKAVYEAVIAQMYVGPNVKQVVVNPAATWGSGGTDDYAARLRRARRDTRRDYLRVMESASAIPRDIDPGVPVSWYTDAQFWAAEKKARADGGMSLEDAWAQLGEAHPGWSGWISMSDVGFSRDGRQAMLDIGSGSAGLSAAYYLVLLEKRDGTWVVVQKVETAIA